MKKILMSLNFWTSVVILTTCTCFEIHLMYIGVGFSLISIGMIATIFIK